MACLLNGDDVPRLALNLFFIRPLIKEAPRRVFGFPVDVAPVPFQRTAADVNLIPFQMTARDGLHNRLEISAQTVGKAVADRQNPQRLFRRSGSPKFKPHPEWTIGTIASTRTPFQLKRLTLSPDE